MKLLIKTLKGENFSVEAEESNTVAQVKTIIETTRSEMTAAGMKLIYSGKVLKDAQTLEQCNVKPNDFLVVMVSKPKKSAAAAAAAPVASSGTASAPASAAAPVPASSGTADTAASPPAPAPAPAAASAAPAPAASSTSSEFPPEVVANLTVMGFPEDMAIACLRAANGNPDVAVEFLTNGIPDAAAPGASSSSGSNNATTSNANSSSSDPLSGLRSHPQLNQLRRLVQTNPQALSAVLTQIGQQQPELLQVINSNQAAFLELMNEPIDDSTPPASSTVGSSRSTPSSSTSSGIPGMEGMMPNPGDMARMLAGLSEAERNEMAGMMGLTPQQLSATAQAIGSMPPEQFQQHMMQAMGQGGAAGLGSPGQQVIRLSEEEMASVNRLTEMGFDRTEAVQAFLACDKNEALAANFLMDGGFGGAGGFGGDSNPGDDDMYD